MTDWLAQFERALAAGEGLADLFHVDSHWRDVLALTWRIQTVSGRDAIAAALKGKRAHDFPGPVRRIVIDKNRLERNACERSSEPPDAYRGN